MRTGIILSSIWLASVLALASVQAGARVQAATAAEQAPAAGEEAPAAADASDAEKPAEAVPAAPAATTTEKPAGTVPAAPAATTEAPAEAAPAAPPAATEEPAEPAPAAPGALGRPAGAPSAPAPAGKVSAITRPMPPLTQYQVLSERNIFSRVRGARAMRPRTGPMVRPPERYLILKGTLGGEKGYVAFIEDTRTSETQVRQAGDVVGQGRITAVGLDGLTYEQNGTATKVAIGEYVGGAPPAGSAPAGATALAAPTGGASDIAERLRQRRLKEEGK